MQRQRIVDRGNVFEVDCVWDLEALHPVSVSPLLKMHLEGSSSPIAKISTDLAFILDTKPMQLVQPVRNRLTVPPKG